MNFLQSGAKNLRFSVFGAEVFCDFCTQSSVSLRVKLGLKQGWIDLHFPCEGHVKVRILAALPDELLDNSKTRELTHELFTRLGIGEDETYEATFFKPINVSEIGQHVDRKGMGDRIETERKFIPPA